MPLFVRIMLAVAAALIALAIVGFLLHIIVIAAIVAAVAVGVLALTRRLRGAGRGTVMTVNQRRF